MNNQAGNRPSESGRKKCYPSDEPGINTQPGVLDWNDVMITIVKANTKLHDLGLNDTQLGAIVGELTTIGTTFKKFYDGQSIKGAGRTILKCLVGEVVDIKFASVVLMAQKMDSRLKEHDHWSGWTNMTRNELAARILENLSGILRAKREVKYDLAFENYIRDQAADIANFAMMLAVNIGELKETKMAEQSEIPLKLIKEVDKGIPTSPPGPNSVYASKERDEEDQDKLEEKLKENYSSIASISELEEKIKASARKITDDAIELARLKLELKTSLEGIECHEETEECKSIGEEVQSNDRDSRSED